MTPPLITAVSLWPCSPLLGSRGGAAHFLPPVRTLLPCPHLPLPPVFLLQPPKEEHVSWIPAPASPRAQPFPDQISPAPGRLWTDLQICLLLGGFLGQRGCACTQPLRPVKGRPLGCAPPFPSSQSRRDILLGLQSQRPPSPRSPSSASQDRQWLLVSLRLYLPGFRASQTQGLYPHYIVDNICIM